MRDRYPTAHTVQRTGKASGHDRIRIGYFSADFRTHPVAFLTVEVFERHDKSRFEVIAFSYRPQCDDDTRKRLATAFDRFLDVRAPSDEGVARLARELEVDIAVDLGGFTGDSRPGIFARRAAPLQVSYLGYPGTMGASLLRAIHLPELVTETPDQYERLAIELATDPDKQREIRRKLGANQPATPLFDMQRFTRHLEVTYADMHARQQAEMPPENIDVQA